MKTLFVLCENMMNNLDILINIRFGLIVIRTCPFGLRILPVRPFHLALARLWPWPSFGTLEPALRTLGLSQASTTQSSKAIALPPRQSAQRADPGRGTARP